MSEKEDKAADKAAEVLEKKEKAVADDVHKSAEDAAAKHKAFADKSKEEK